MAEDSVLQLLRDFGTSEDRARGSGFVICDEKAELVQEQKLLDDDDTARLDAILKMADDHATKKVKIVPVDEKMRQNGMDDILKEAPTENATGGPAPKFPDYCPLLHMAYVTDQGPERSAEYPLHRGGEIVNKASAVG